MRRISQTGTLIIIGNILLSMLLLSNCSQQSEGGDDPGKLEQKEVTEKDPLKNKGIGPVSNVELGMLDETMVAAGKKIYDEKCTACHNIKEKLIGPPQAGVLERRSPEWVMNLILNPEEMLKKDPIAKELLKEFNNVPMTNQQLTQDEARKILEFFRTI